MNSSFVSVASLPRRDSLYLKQHTPALQAVLQTPKGSAKKSLSAAMAGAGAASAIMGSAAVPTSASASVSAQNRRLSIRKPQNGVAAAGSTALNPFNTMAPPLNAFLPSTGIIAASVAAKNHVASGSTNHHFQMVDEFKKREDRLLQDTTKLRDENSRLKLEFQDFQKLKAEENTALRQRCDELETMQRVQHAQFSQEVNNLQSHIQNAQVEFAHKEESMNFEIQNAKDLNIRMAKQLETLNIHPVTFETLAAEDEARARQMSEFTVRSIPIYLF